MVVPEGLARYGGRCRHELEWRVSQDGEIELRPNRENVMFSGYQRGSILVNPFNDDGWFKTGDLGRVDELGNLIFIERLSESIRVKGEFVPISYVEDTFSKVDCIKDVAIWRRPSHLVDDEIVMYVEIRENREIDLVQISEVRQKLPAFMQPIVMLVIDQIPRDAGVGKIRRRQLSDCNVISEVQL
jgi:crotonobetaine/carnitine-CoA ligase